MDHGGERGMRHGRGHGKGRGHGPDRRGRGEMPGPRRGRARRGDVRLALLALLVEEAGTGYALIQRIEQRTDGVWKASPGSVYPTLAQLVDEGLVASVAAEGGGNEFSITASGEAHVREREEDIARVWEQTEGAREGADGLRHATHRLMNQVRELSMDATDEQLAEATAKIHELRKELKRLAK
ncbi:PadR family transcriptional regulator [Actinomyces minihominis]|uniref:PadR family transcriptional regulator n=1 Tax=Actinomyces minihominis TaxID=2002838 RepID=UPI0013ED3490|nr:PadR family transcriptional regulator [Actinomyces minihominis]